MTLPRAALSHGFVSPHSRWFNALMKWVRALLFRDFDPSTPRPVSYSLCHRFALAADGLVVAPLNDSIRLSHDPVICFLARHAARAEIDPARPARIARWHRAAGERRLN